MIASAPASSSCWARRRWSLLGQVSRSMPQWTATITASALAAAARTVSRTRARACECADAIPGVAALAAKPEGTIMEAPTKATRTPLSVDRSRYW